MKREGKRACIYGFEPSLMTSLREILYFAGADPFEVEEVSGFSKMFKTQPPDIMVMSAEALEMLDFHVMVGGDPQFDRIAIIVGTRDVYSPKLREALETCATDFFLLSQPYHLKRLAVALMSQNPWSNTPTLRGKLLLADGNLARRIAVARALRIARFDVEFAESSEELHRKLSSDHTYRMVLVASKLGQEEGREILCRLFSTPTTRRPPCLIYEEGLILTNSGTGSPSEFVQVGSDFSPESVSFHVQSVLSTPLKNQRRSERLPFFTPVRFVVERIREEIWGYSTDISENGLYIRTLVPPPPETMLTISFRPPTAEGTVQLGARVAWRKEYGEGSSPSKHPGFGVEFTRISEPDRAAVLAGYRILAAAVKIFSTTR